MLPDGLFTGDTIFTEGCGSCSSQGSASSMFKTIQNIKNTVDPSVRIYPGHSYGKSPGSTLDYLLKENIYFQIDKENTFINFRMRKNQKNILCFR